MRNVAVLGAAGKMGSGISLLLLQEMARREMEEKVQKIIEAKKKEVDIEINLKPLKEEDKAVPGK